MVFSILFSLETFFPQSKAGTEIYALNLAKALREIGHTISFVVPHKESTYVENYTYEGCNVYTFPVRDEVSSKEANGLIPPKGLSDFIDIVKNVKPDIVHFHSFGRSINYYHLLAVKNLSLKTVFTPHLGGVFCARGDFKYLGKTPCSGKVDLKKCFTCFAQSKTNNTLAAHLLSYIYTPIQLTPLRRLFPAAWQIVAHRQKELNALKAADAVVGLSPWIIETLKSNGIEENVYLVLQGIQNSIAAVTIADKDVHNPIVGYIGRIYPIKGIELLLEASKILGNKINLKIITMKSASDDIYYDDIKKRCMEFKNVTWIENLAHNNFLEEFMSLDYLCVPSLHEMAPLAALEATALKIPVLGSSIPAIKDIITHNINGLLFRRGDALDLANQLERITKEPDLLLKLKKNLEPVRTFKNIGDEMELVYKSILNLS